MSDESRAPGAPTPSDTPTRARQDALLEVFADCGNIRTAAKHAGIHRSTHYEWMANDPDYAKRFAAAKDEFADLCREWARTRGGLGISQEIHNAKGEFVGLRTSYSDRILERLLEANCTEYRRKTEVATTHSGSVSLEVKELAEILSTEELLAIRDRLRSRSADQSGTGGAGAPPQAP